MKLHVSRPATSNRDGLLSKQDRNLKNSHFNNTNITPTCCVLTSLSLFIFLSSTKNDNEMRTGRLGTARIVIF